MGGGATAVNNNGGDRVTGYNAGILNGNQLDTTLQAPVNVAGNALSILGFSSASA